MTECVVLGVYLLLGLFVLVIANDTYVWENPLWELAITILWPMAVLVMIVSGLIEYVNKVIKYYKKKGGRKNGRKKRNK